MKSMVVLAAAAAMGMGIAASAQAQTPDNQQTQQAQQTQQPGQFGAGIIPSGVYVRGNLGYSWSAQDEIDYSPIWGLGVGYRLNPNFRGDVTFDWRDRYIVEGASPFALGGTNVDSRVDSRALMLNLYYDFDRLPIVELPGALKPFVGAGIGISRLRVDDQDVVVANGDVARFTGEDQNQFAWQLTAGLAYNITPSLAADVAYRYAHLGEVELTSQFGQIGDDLRVHEAVVSLRYQF